jgi:nucleoside-diphosphate-sugar epimerase
LVTGGAGFIGSNLVKLLLSRGHAVGVLDNLSSGYRQNLIPDAKFIEADLRDHGQVEQASKGVEVIFHLGASVGNTRSIERPLEDAQINVLGTLHVLEAARKNGVRKVVFSSSAGIFGELKTLPIREDHPVDPDSPYGASKLGAEKLCLAYAKLYPLECVCLRYFNVYGVNQRFDAYGNVIPIFAHRIFNNRQITIFGDGEQTRDFVNVQDVAMANYLAGTNKGTSGAFNIGSGTRISISNLAKMMREITGRKTEIIFGPPRKGDVRDSLADITAARESLGFKPAAELAAGLKDYLAWAEKEMSPSPQQPCASC